MNCVLPFQNTPFILVQLFFGIFGILIIIIRDLAIIIIITRAGVCKTLCPKQCLTLTLLDSNPTLLAHDSNNCTNIRDFSVILLKGEIPRKWVIIRNRIKIWVTYNFMRNPYMKFQNISIHGSKLMPCTIKQQMTKNRKGP